LLASRLVAVTDWLRGLPEARNRSIGYLGASTGAAAALIAAAERPEMVDAVVSRGGRPDLAAAALEQVRAPTLFIVGGEDAVVLGLNEEALWRLQTPGEMAIIEGATHLFEEPGALDDVARLAAAWFDRHLVGRPRETQPAAP
jgi:putative phosphoribosyl transferase